MSRGTIYVAILALLFALALPSLNEDGSFIVARNVHRLLTVVYRITGAGTPTVSAEQSALEMFFRGMFSVLRMDDDAHFLADFRRLADPSFPLQAQPRYIPGVDVSEILLDDGTGVRAMLIVDAAVKQSKVLGGKNAPTLLYFHGGGFSTLSVNFFRSYLAGLSRAAAIRIVAVDYRLVPEHSIQDALDDCMAWYQQLIKDGVRPATIFLGGDSAGAYLAFAVATKLRDTKQPSPAAVLLLTPWLDLHLTGSTVQTANDPLLPTKAVKRFSSIALPHASGIVAPLTASLKGLPPFYVSGAGQDPLFDDARRFVTRALETKHEVEHSFQETGFHDWFIAWYFGVPESAAELQRIGAYIKAHLHAFFMSTRAARSEQRA